MLIKLLQNDVLGEYCLDVTVSLFWLDYFQGALGVKRKIVSHHSAVSE